MGNALALCDASDFADEAPGTDRALRGASEIVNQCAGIVGLCALGLDLVAHDEIDVPDPCIDLVKSAAPKLIAKCWDDLAVAASLID
ncbi:hypothetical protein [Eggerthella timonensis]|uniref:hypothetical protein n=1 Tax=Eggerthella timonensis TaxID=1871008 RepID=UPI0011AF7809|nr:hypothetical protein [Eggerthella timonensis]